MSIEEPRQLEDWQEWQIRADKAAEDASGPRRADFHLSEPGRGGIRRPRLWPRFRDMKERVRIAPAIRLEAKLELERRLRHRSKSLQVPRSGERPIGRAQSGSSDPHRGLRATAEKESSPRALRGFRRSFDALRQEFDKGADLVPSDRQAVWDAWRDANQFSWQRLVDIWEANKQELRSILTDVRQQIERGNGPAARQGLTRFFEAISSTRRSSSR